MRATSGRSGRETMAATFWWEDEDEVAMLIEYVGRVQEDCTEFGGKSFDHEVRTGLAEETRGSLPLPGLGIRFHRRSCNPVPVKFFLLFRRPPTEAPPRARCLPCQR